MGALFLMFHILDIWNIITSFLHLAMLKSVGRTFGEISHNLKIKEYPHHYELCISSHNYFLSEGWEKRDLTKVKDEKKTKSASAESTKRSMDRAKKNIRDIALCSGFSHFVTLTIAKEKMDRYNYSAMICKINRWLSNCVQRHAFAYVLVPELHKDGAIHFHGFVKGEITFAEANVTTQNGQKIFNLKNWKFGFSACMEIPADDYEKIVNYVRKYITKDTVKIGGRWYLSGGKIQKPSVSYSDCDYREIEAIEYYVPEARVSFKYLRIDKNTKTGLQILESKLGKGSCDSEKGFDIRAGSVATRGCST